MFLWVNLIVNLQFDPMLKFFAFVLQCFIIVDNNRGCCIWSSEGWKWCDCCWATRGWDGWLWLLEIVLQFYIFPSNFVMELSNRLNKWIHLTYRLCQWARPMNEVMVWSEFEIIFKAKKCNSWYCSKIYFRVFWPFDNELEVFEEVG